MIFSEEINASAYLRQEYAYILKEQIQDPCEFLSVVAGLPKVHILSLQPLFSLLNVVTAAAAAAAAAGGVAMTTLVHIEVRMAGRLAHDNVVSSVVISVCC